MAETILFKLVAQDAGVNAAIVSNREEIKKLNKEIAAAKGANGYTDLVRQLTDAKIKASELKAEQRALNKEFQATQVPKDSLAGLRLEYSKLTDQITKLSAAERNSDFGKGLVSSAARVKKEIGGIEESLGRFTGNVGNYKSALLSLTDIVTGGLIGGGIIATIQGIVSIGQTAIQVNAQVSDKIADVAKAANISTEQVQKLSDVLEQRNTRTSLVDQLGIAEIGGKLGVAQDQLQGFVESVDVVNVALGDQFGGSVEQTTDVIGKLRNVLNDIKTDNVGADILQIGNALNFLEAEGAASAGTIADFTGRIAGLGQQFGISSGDIIGVSATLDELGVNAERGASGFVRVLQRVAASPGEFAKAAGVSAKEFTELVNKDLFGAVELFLGKVNDKNLSNTELEKLLKQLDLDGIGTVEVVGKLGGNLDLLSKRTAQAGRALNETSSVTQEYEKKNATLGASVQSLSNAFQNLFADGALADSLKGIVDGATDLVDTLSGAYGRLFDFGAATSGAAQANDILSASFQKAAQEVERDSIATERNFNILRDGRATQDQRKGAINDLIKLYPSLLTQQQLESANIEQLNGLQILSTNVLRTQITERLKLRAKEQIESEIVQKKLRQVELDATPDRALLGQLTAGETIRNFGVIDPNKLRSNIKAQFKSDISELESSLKRVDKNFAALQRSAEDNLSAAQQDALDAFRQFNDGGKTAADGLKEQTKKTLEEGKKTIEGIGTSTGKSAKEQANAYELVKKRVDELTERLQVAVTQNNTGAIPKILGDLTKAQIQLQIIDATVARIKSGAANDNRSIAQRVRNPLSDNAPAPGSDLGSDPVSAEIDRAKFANAEIVDDERKTNQELLKLQSDLSDANLAQIKSELDKENALRQAAADSEEERRRRRREQIIQASIDAAESIAGAVLEIEGQRIESTKEKAIADLDEEYKKRLDAAQGNAVLQEKINKEFEAKKLTIEKKAAKQRQDLAVKEAIVQGALAVVRALATSNFAAAIAAGVATLAQIAIIKNQKFERGGMVKFGKFGGKPHSQGGTKGQFDDGTRVEVEKDEVFAIVNKRNAPMLRKLSAVNSFGGNGTRFFEKGGALDFRPQVALPAQSALIQVLPSQASFTDAQSAQIGEIAGREIAKILAPVMQNSIGLGLNDSNQRLQREQSLLKNRTV